MEEKKKRFIVLSGLSMLAKRIWDGDKNISMLSEPLLGKWRWRIQN